MFIWREIKKKRKTKQNLCSKKFVNHHLSLRSTGRHIQYYWNYFPYVAILCCKWNISNGHRWWLIIINNNNNNWVKLFIACSESFNRFHPNGILCLLLSHKHILFIDGRRYILNESLTSNVHLNASNIDDAQTIHSIESIYHSIKTVWSWYSRKEKKTKTKIERNIMLLYLNDKNPSIFPIYFLSFSFFFFFFFEINCQHDTTRTDTTIVCCWRLSRKQDEFMVKMSKTENYTRTAIKIGKKKNNKNRIISIAIRVACTPYSLH